VNKTPNGAPAPDDGMREFREEIGPNGTPTGYFMFAAPTSAATPAIVVPPGLIYALRHQRQVDEDGTECGVSRQAVDEAIVILEKVAASQVRHSCETDLLSDCPACSADADAAIAASDGSAATPGDPCVECGADPGQLCYPSCCLAQPVASAAPGAVDDAMAIRYMHAHNDAAGPIPAAAYVSTDELPCIIAGLTAALAHPKPDGPQLPNGWRVEPKDNGRLLVTSASGVQVIVGPMAWQHSIAAHVLHELLHELAPDGPRAGGKP
jgi:hypothetical protein